MGEWFEPITGEKCGSKVNSNALAGSRVDSNPLAREATLTRTDDTPSPRKAVARRPRKFQKRLPIPSVLDGLDVLLRDAYGHVPLRRTLQYFGRPDKK